MSGGGQTGERVGGGRRRERAMKRHASMDPKSELLSSALRDLAQHLEDLARASFARSSETLESDWKLADPAGYALWSKARAALDEAR